MFFLNKKQADELIEHSKKESPNEVCGILAGLPLPQKNSEVKEVYQMINTDKSKKTFFMDPEQQLKVMKEIRNLGLDMVGIYHSHLETEAYPSSHDVELAFYPEASYVIVSIKNRDNPVIKSFKIVEGKIIEEAISCKLEKKCP